MPDILICNTATKFLETTVFAVMRPDYGCPGNPSRHWIGSIGPAKRLAFEHPVCIASTNLMINDGALATRLQASTVSATRGLEYKSEKMSKISDNRLFDLCNQVNHARFVMSMLTKTISYLV